MEKKLLTKLSLNWVCRYGQPKGEPLGIDEEVLENLHPSTSLKELTINYYGGIQFPRWIGEPSFTNLATIRISNCPMCKQLPPLGQLPFLKHLNLSRMDGLKLVGLEFFSSGFPSLLKLKIREMCQLKSWHRADNGQFPYLSEIVIIGCPKLTSFPLITLPSIKHLEIASCCALEFSTEDQLPASLTSLIVQDCSSLSKWCQKYPAQLVPISMIAGTDSRKLRVQNMFTLEEVRKTNLMNFQHVDMLELVWDTVNFRSSCEAIEEINWVAESLRPNCSLREVVIRGYAGSRFASWLGDCSFSKLITLKLFSCSNCKFLPPLGQLPSLAELHVKGMDGVELVGQEFFGNGLSTGFPSLHQLIFEDMSNWKEWSGTMEDKFPSLYALTISNCPKLGGLPGIFPSLTMPVLDNCHEKMSTSLPFLTSLSNLDISHVPLRSELPILPPSVSHLSILDCMGLAPLPVLPFLSDTVLTKCRATMISGSFCNLAALKRLTISHIPELKTLSLCHLHCLEEFSILNCPELIVLQFDNPYSSLKHLSVRECPVVKFSENGKLPSTLILLHIIGCPLLRNWCRSCSSGLAHIAEVWVDHKPVRTKDKKRRWKAFYFEVQRHYSPWENAQRRLEEWDVK